MRIIVVLLAILSLQVCNAQDFNNYQPLVSYGELPEDFTQLTSSKVARDLSTQIDDNDDGLVKKSKSDFLLKSNYMVDELLMSGRVLFGDPVSEYVNQVADKVLSFEPELKDELRFYCVKSNVTNAFTTNQGMIFVTLGLISQLENEAQLAFVLAHEITHYKKKHVINSYVESDRVLAKKGSFKYNNYDNNIIRLSNYSKKLEFESDSVGLSIIKKIGYDVNEALMTFDVLQFSHLPYDEIEFDCSFLESESFIIPESYKLDSIIPINFDGDYDDAKSTHPNVNKRRKKIVEGIKKVGKGGEKYLVSKEQFELVRELCRFEAIRLNLKDREYVRAIYNAQILQKIYPESFFLKKSIAKAIYSISKYKTYRVYHNIVDDYDDYEGNITSAYFVFDELNRKQFSAIAIKYLWELYNDTQEDQIKELLVSTMKDFFIENKLSYSEFKTPKDIEEFIEEVEMPDSLNVELGLVDGEERNGKYEKLRKIREEQEKEELAQLINTEEAVTEDFYLMAFVDIKENEGLMEEFKRVEGMIDEEKKSVEDKNNRYEGLSNYQRRKAEFEDQKSGGGNDVSIAAKKVVYIDPDYLIVDERKGVKLMNSEEKKVNLIDQIEQASKEVRLKVDVVSSKLFKSDDVEAYNQLAAFNEWVGEAMDHEDVNDEMEIIPSVKEYVVPIAELLGTNFISYSGVYAYRQDRRGVAGYIMMSVFFPPYLPFAIYYAVTPRYTTYFYTWVYDVETGEKVLNKVFVKKNKTNDKKISSWIEKTMEKMKEKPTK